MCVEGCVWIWVFACVDERVCECVCVGVISTQKDTKSECSHGAPHRSQSWDICTQSKVIAAGRVKKLFLIFGWKYRYCFLSQLEDLPKIRQRDNPISWGPVKIPAGSQTVITQPKLEWESWLWHKLHSQPLHPREKIWGLYQGGKNK